jgi:CHAD domain-containing protein
MIHAAAMNLIRELGDWKPLGADNLHEFRLKVKQLRYTLQLDEHADPGLLQALGDVQRRIGDWHDWLQLEEIARETLIHEEDRALLDRIDATVKRRFDRALAAANALRGRYFVMPFAAGI